MAHQEAIGGNQGSSRGHRRQSRLIKRPSEPVKRSSRGNHGSSVTIKTHNESIGHPKGNSMCWSIGMRQRVRKFQ